MEMSYDGMWNVIIEWCLMAGIEAVGLSKEKRMSQVWFLQHNRDWGEWNDDVISSGLHLWNDDEDERSWVEWMQTFEKDNKGEELHLYFYARRER